MPRLFKKIYYLTFIVLIASVSGCASSSGAVSSHNVNGHADAPFGNVLVIGIAADYERRSQFERKLASDLRASGIKATALFIAAGGNKPIDKASVEKLVADNGFDAVLLTRLINSNAEASMKSGSASTKATNKGGAAGLFRYDYEELNEPTRLDLSLSVSFRTELFAASDSKQAWSLESSISAKDYVELITNEAAEKIVRRLKRDRMIGT